MASTNQPNGISPPRHRSLTPPSLSFPPHRVLKRTRSASPFSCSLFSSLQPGHSHQDAHTSAHQGRSPFPRSPAPSANGGGLPSWNAAALLNPKAHAAAPARAQDQQRSSVQNANTANHMVFQFSSANGTPNSGYQSPATPTPEDDVDGSSQDAPAAGMSRMIERMNNIQDRSSFPLPKRRKIDENEDGSSTPNSFRSGGNGMLGEYVRQQRDQSQPVPSLRSAPSVDLTGGESKRKVLLCCAGLVADREISG